MAGLNAVDFSIHTDRAAVEAAIATHISDLGTRQFLIKSVYWVEPGKQLGFRFNLDSLNKNIENIGEALPEGSYIYRNNAFFTWR